MPAGEAETGGMQVELDGSAKGGAVPTHERFEFSRKPV